MSGPPDAAGSASARLAAELRIQALRSVLLHSAVAARLGIVVTDFNCLNLLSLEGPRAPSELAGRLGLTTGGATTTMIDRLEAAGYVRRRRDQRDRRRIRVELEPRARAMIAPLLGDLGRAVGTVLDAYSADEAELLLDFVRRINELTLGATTALRAGGRP